MAASRSLALMTKPTHSYSLMSSATSQPSYGAWTRACWTSFDLTDEGTFRLKQFGEQTGPEILERGYPVLSETLESEAFAEHAIEGVADPQKYVQPQPRSFARLWKPSVIV